MSTVANKPYSAHEAAAASREKRKLIFLVCLVAVLILLLVWELPKLLGGSESSTSGATLTTVAAAAPAASTDATAAQPATATPTGGAVPVASEPAKKSQAWIKRLPARDPFVPLVGALPASSPLGPTPVPTPVPTPTPTPAPAPTPTPTQKPATTPPVKAAVPTSAVIWTNGRRQVIATNDVFDVGDASFKLLSVTPNAIKVTAVEGSFKGAKGPLTVKRGKAVTLEDTVTGVQYTLRFSLPLTTVPASNSKK